MQSFIRIKPIKPGPRRTESQIAAIDAEWESIAYLAYGAFLEYGQGVILLDVSKIAGQGMVGDSYEVELAFVPIGEKLRLVTASEIAYVHRWLNEYNPELEVIVMFLMSDDTSSVHKVSRAPSPLEIYNRYERTN
jgi:hypothetical protein